MSKRYPTITQRCTLLCVAVCSFIAVLELTVATGKARGLNPAVSQVPAFAIVGITARTSNAIETTPAGVIGNLWGRLMKENLLDKIPNRADQTIIAVYTDYSSDKNGEYTYILGAKVSRDAKIPAEMVMKKIPAGKYAVFTSERGPTTEVVPEIWRRINSLPKTAPGGDRTYRSDFEVYDERARNPQDSVVEVYVGIR